MTTTRTTMSGIDGIPRAVSGLDLRAAGARPRGRGAALALFTVALLLLVAF
jgi:hypothetical protein